MSEALRLTLASVGLAATSAVVAVAIDRRLRKAHSRHFQPKFVESPDPTWTLSPGKGATVPHDSEKIVTLLPSEMDKASIYTFVISGIVPRPVAIVSTISKDGIRNLSPYSYFNTVGHNPPLVCIGICRSPSRGGGKKDTLQNIEDTGEFTISLLSSWFAEAANHTSGEFPSEVDEWELSGLTPAPSQQVKPPRVKEAAVAMECKLRHLYEVEARDGSPASAVVIGEVVAFQVHEAATTTSPTGKLMMDPLKMGPISRLGGTTYGAVTELFNVPRPDAQGNYPPRKP